MAQRGGPVNLVFVVCHPDDESLWAGGLLHGLSRFDFVRTWVLCVSGEDPESVRAAEFGAALDVAGATGGVVLGGPLRGANDPLPDIAATTRGGLERLGLGVADVDLLVTHSPYGDEHLNPHHIQAYEQLLDWSRASGVPFGWFSVLLLPWLLHQPLLPGLRRHEGTFHLLSMARCVPTPGLALRLRHRHMRARLRPPRYHVQVAGDLAAKRRMLECYESIDLPAHEAGYGAFTTATESLYLMDAKGLAPLRRVFHAMATPGPPDLFARL